MTFCAIKPDFRLQTHPIDLVTHWSIQTTCLLTAAPECEIGVMRQLLGQDVADDRLAAERLGQAMLKMPQVEIPVEHFFGDKVYLRKIMIPKGAMAVGRIQKLEHISIVISGDMTVWNEHDGLCRIKGPAITSVKPGVKRVGYAHEDTVWATAHGTESRDIENMVDHLTVATYADYRDFCLRLLPEGSKP